MVDENDVKELGCKLLCAEVMIPFHLLLADENNLHITRSFTSLQSSCSNMKNIKYYIQLLRGYVPCTEHTVSPRRLINLLLVQYTFTKQSHLYLVHKQENLNFPTVLDYIIEGSEGKAYDNISCSQSSKDFLLDGHESFIPSLKYTFLTFTMSQTICYMPRIYQTHVFL